MGYFNAIYKADISHNAVSVYMYLYDRANRDDECFPAIGTIARELKLSRSSVKRGINELLQHGFLVKEHRWRENGGKSSSLFKIVKPPP